MEESTPEADEVFVEGLPVSLSFWKQVYHNITTDGRAPASDQVLGLLHPFFCIDPILPYLPPRPCLVPCCHSRSQTDFHLDT
jgi:hypothetical protein